MSDTELLPCPFCGGLAWMHKHDPHDGFWPNGAFRIECQKCHAATTHWHTEAQAVESWNQRAALVGQPNNEARDALAEREAKCCPEDVGFEEYIATLEKRLAARADWQHSDAVKAAHAHLLDVAFAKPGNDVGGTRMSNSPSRNILPNPSQGAPCP